MSELQIVLVAAGVIAAGLFLVVIVGPMIIRMWSH